MDPAPTEEAYALATSFAPIPYAAPKAYKGRNIIFFKKRG
jgi:hypothetical protein